jgi:hypothetical protein
LDARDSSLDYREFHEEGVDTLAHITRLWIGLVGAGSAAEDFHPKITTLRMAASVIFVRTEDAALIHQENIARSGSTRNFDDWLADDAKELRVSVQKVGESVAQAIASAVTDLNLEEVQ